MSELLLELCANHLLQFSRFCFYQSFISKLYSICHHGCTHSLFIEYLQKALMSVSMRKHFHFLYCSLHHSIIIGIIMISLSKKIGQILGVINQIPLYQYTKKNSKIPLYLALPCFTNSQFFFPLFSGANI